MHFHTCSTKQTIVLLAYLLNQRTTLYVFYPINRSLLNAYITILVFELVIWLKSVVF